MLQHSVLVYSDTHESAATLEIRILGPLRERGFECVDARTLLARGRALADLWDHGFDAVVVHRAIKRRCNIYPLLLGEARRRRIPVIHDTDDLLFQVHREHPDHAVYQAKAVYALKAVLDADVVVASTQALAEHLSALCASVVVIPNVLPRALWGEVCDRCAESAGTGDSERITVGYVGSKTHRPDLEVVEDTLLALLARHRGRVRLLCVGVPLTPRLRRQPWVEEILPPKHVERSYREFVRFAAALPIDVGIAPLQDVPFNRCKSDVKFQEYAALGIAGVYSDLAPYHVSVRHGENGFLAADPAQWLECLERLVGSSELRRSLARSAAADVQANWRSARAAELWENLVEQAKRQVQGNAAPNRHPLAPVFQEMMEYQSGLERRLRWSLQYQVGKTFSRLMRKLAS